MSDVEITVLLPCFNAAEYIKDAIGSVLNQTFRNFELLIINDGSTDGSVEIIKSFRDERIVLIHQEQQGVASALNNGLRHARASYIARFDADDICFPDRLEKQYRFMTENPDYIIAGSAANYTDESGQFIFTYRPLALTHAEITNLRYDCCPFIHASVIYKKESIATIGYNVHAYSFEDHLLWLTLKGKGKMFNTPEPLLNVRLNPGSLTMDERKRSKIFRQLKNNALKSGQINAADGKRLQEIIREQNGSEKKEGAYYSLLAKKYLWNNYDPSQSRRHMRRALKLNKFDIKDYMLMAISYLPKPIVHNLYAFYTSVK